MQAEAAMELVKMHLSALFPANCHTIEKRQGEKRI